jgi:hypothetical protein
MADLLGRSIKSVESYEQGLRNIPVNIERIVYFLLFKLNMDKFDNKGLCWDIKKCPGPTRENCIAWTAQEGFFCWFLTAKVCSHERSISGASTSTCFACSFFRNNLEKIGL